MKSNKIPYYARYAGVGLLLSAAVVQADISGKVFHDFNGNGTFDTASPQVETGVAGVIVTATDATGSTASATTAADGTYTFPNSGATATGNKVRIEFSNLPEFSNSGSSATGTTTQFVTANAADVNFAVTYADNFCQANPQMVTPLYRSGADNNQVLRFSYNNEGLSELDKTNIATSSVIGSLWGVAYSRSQKQLYAAAVLKRHIPLGSGGLDAIYTIDLSTGIPNATPWLQLTDDLGIAVSTVSANPQYQDNTARGVDAPPQNDATAFIDVMKVGIGDIELSADEKTLYAMNVYDKKVYAIDVASKTLKGSYALPDASCSNGQSRPWALGEHQGKIYAGVTCDGSASGNPANLADDSGAANLKASVYRLDGVAFTQVLTFPLDYLKEPPFQYDDKCKVMTKWKPWTDALPDTCSDGNISYPSPLLSDIEFEDNGNMILGFTDRTGFQVGHKNYGPTGTTLYSLYVAGDILKACKTASGWGIEGTVAGCSSAGGLAINQADPDGYPMSWGDILDKAGEFYEGDFFHNDGNTDGTGLSYFPGHPEIIVGGLSVVPNTGEVMSVTYDPVTGAANYGTGGVITLNNQTGKRPRNGFELYRTTDADPETASKGVGLGDLEVLCDPAPIEVGNRVWNDTDGDGIQDADEAGIDGVDVVLTCGTDTATVTTANGGQFLFSSASNATFMSAGESCKVTVNSAGQTSLDGLSVTKQNADNVTDNQATTDLRDSDATSAGEIAFTVGNVGENNHTLDIGYKAAPVVDAWCPVGAVENFLLNGSFEQGAAGDNAPNWTGENNISTSSSVNPKPHGSQFAFTWTPETFYQDADISSVPEGQALKLSYYSGSHEPSDQAVSIQYLTAPGGTVIGTAQALAVTHDVDSDAQLAQQELILGAKPAGANAVRVSVYGGSVDFIKIDAMCLYAGETPSVATLDFGDAPDTYKTLLAMDGARHTIVSGLHLGAVVDAEADGQPNTAADGDGNDEDGVNFMTPLIPGEAAVIGVGTIQPRGSDAKLDGWIDFNGDGDFDDPGEQIASSRNIKASTLRDQASLVLDVNVPADAKFGQTYARFRLSTAGGLTPSGEAADGEVEDYAITLAQGATLGDYIWQDTNKDGIQDSGEPAVAGVLVNLIRVSDDKIVKSTFSDGNGAYLFTGIMPDTYQVEFVAPTGYSLTAATQGGDPDKDSDADSTTGRTPNISVALGDNQRQWDAGLVLTDNTLVYCDAVPFQPTELNETLSLPKFNSTLGNLTGVSISAYGATRQLIAAEVFASQAQTVKLKSSVEGFLTLPDATSVDTLTSYDSGSKALSAADGILDYWGTSAFALSDWDYTTNSQTKVYSTLADFTAAADGVMVSLPYETMSGLSTVGGGGNTQVFQRTFAGASACVTYSYEKSVPAVDVELSKAVEPSTAKRGETVVYTLTAKNTGADVATGVVVADKLPNGVAYVSDDGGVGAYNAATGEWVVGDLAKDASKVLKITVTVK